MCPGCGAAAHPLGGRLVIVGHGLVERQIHGPAAPGAPPEQALVRLRRYRCRACRAVLIVGPRGVVPRRWYSAGAIALALSAYARGATSAGVRATISAVARLGRSAVERWITLARWLDAAGRGKLFGIAGLGDLPRRRVAEQVMVALAARAGHVLGDDLAASAFVGAAIAA